VADPSPLKGGLLFVVGGSWEDPQLGQSQEAPCYRDKQMLHVQEDGGVCGPFLLHCDVASAISYSLFNCFGLSWVMRRRVINLLACW
jgi:hypothetical protein